jgi:signal transduction histidine kinase
MTAVNDQRETDVPATGRISALAGRLDRGELHPVRGPFTRWPHATDSALAVVVFAVTLVFVAVSELDDGDTFSAASIGDLSAGAFVLLGVAAAALWWRRSRPLAVTVFVLAVMVVWALAGFGDGHDLILVVALYSVGRYCSDHRHSLATVAAAFSVSILGSVIDTNQRIDVWPAVIFTALPWYVGRRIRNRGDYLTLLRERAERLEAEQHARAREAVAAERSRIARELHDVVAHQVTMMTVQAGAAKTIARHDVDTAVEAMGDVERAGRAALGELRHLLGVLRHSVADPDHLGPPPGLDGITALVDELSHTGADVTLTLADLPEHNSAALDLSAYRVVQESFTNIIKHAGPDPTVHVSVAVDNDTLVIDITNTITTTTRTTRTASPGLPSSGYGIAGMRERATLLGGTLIAEPQPPNRFHVKGRLPLEPNPT